MVIALFMIMVNPFTNYHALILKNSEESENEFGTAALATDTSCFSTRYPSFHFTYIGVIFIGSGTLKPRSRLYIEDDQVDSTDSE